MVDKSGNYHCIRYKGTFIQRPGWKLGINVTKIAYDRYAISKFITAYDAFVEEQNDAVEQEDSEDLRGTWVEAVQQEHDCLIEHLQRIEVSVEQVANKKIVEARAEALTLKQQRIQFYATRAAALNPPLNFTSLSKERSFRRAIDIPKAPSERAWKSLIKRIGQDQEGARNCDPIVYQTLNEMLEFDEFYEQDEPPTQHPKAKEYSDLGMRRSFSNPEYPLKEQVFVLNLADKVISDLYQDSLIEYYDFVHLILHGIFEAYQNIDDNDKPLGENGRYQLLMDDARMVYRIRILPLIASRFGNVDRLGIPGRFESVSELAGFVKCPGFDHKHDAYAAEFEELMEHIWREHGKFPAVFRSFHVPMIELPKDSGFPWHRARWPRKMPMLRLYEKDTGRWNPHSKGQFIRTPYWEPYTPSWQYISLDWSGVYAQRHVLPSQDGPPLHELVANVLYVVELLKDTALPAPYLAQISWTYAQRRFGRHHSYFPMALLEALHVALVQKGREHLFNSFRCGTCDGKCRPSKFARKPRPFGLLVHHIIERHKDTGRHGTGGVPLNCILTVPPRGMWTMLNQPECKPALDIFNRLWNQGEEEGLTDPKNQKS